MQQKNNQLIAALILIGANCTATKPQVISKTPDVKTDAQLLEREHREFADYMLSSLRGLHHETCSCDVHDYCRPLVQRIELDTRVNQWTKTIVIVVPQAFPLIAQELQKTTDTDLGARIANLAIKNLPRSEQLRWLKMVSSCWGAQSTESPPCGDLGSGKPMSPSAVKVSMTSCEESSLAAGVSRPFAFAKCACVTDYFLSLTTAEAKSVVAGLQRSSVDPSIVESAIRCNEWAVSMGASNFELTPYSVLSRPAAKQINQAFQTCIAGKAVSGLSQGQRENYCDRTVWYDLRLGEVMP